MLKLLEEHNRQIQVAIGYLQAINCSVYIMCYNAINSNKLILLMKCHLG